jgi:hypothetical protein
MGLDLGKMTPAEKKAHILKADERELRDRIAVLEALVERAACICLDEARRRARRTKGAKKP